MSEYKEPVCGYTDHHNSLQYMWVSSPFLTGWNGSESSSADGKSIRRNIQVPGCVTWVSSVAVCIAYGLEMLLYAHTSQGTITTTRLAAVLRLLLLIKPELL